MTRIRQTGTRKAFAFQEKEGEAPTRLIFVDAGAGWWYVIDEGAKTGLLTILTSALIKEAYGIDLAE